MLRAAFLGSDAWLDGCAPPERSTRLLSRRFRSMSSDRAGMLAELARFDPDVTVIFDPADLEADLLAALTELPGPTVGLLGAGIPEQASAIGALERLDRLVGLDPGLTGVSAGSAEVLRAVPPPVADRFFAPVRALHHAPRAMSIGRSNGYRESMLLPAKHHHDLLQLIHGVSGEPLAGLLSEYDVGVHVAPEGPGGFGQQVGLHLAAGQLLMSTPLAFTHGLERDIDYLQFDSPEGLVWSLERLARFPEMYQRVRIRGRLKAEHYRASRLFDRLLGDVLADITAFG